MGPHELDNHYTTMSAVKASFCRLQVVILKHLIVHIQTAPKALSLTLKTELDQRDFLINSKSGSYFISFEGGS